MSTMLMNAIRNLAEDPILLVMFILISAVLILLFIKGAPEAKQFCPRCKKEIEPGKMRVTTGFEEQVHVHCYEEGRT